MMMKNTDTMNIKSKIAKCLVAGTCFALISTSTAFAAEVPESRTGAGASASVEYSVESSYESPALYEKHREIDAYLFEQGGLEAFQDLGFSITSTGPVGSVIEIGITPYEESYAEAIYEMFGEELVNVVDGVQAVTLIAEAEGEAATSYMNDAAVSVMVVGGPEPGEGEAAITSVEGPDSPVASEPLPLAEDGADQSSDSSEVPSDTPVSDDVVTDAELISAPAGDGAEQAQEVIPISAPVDGAMEAGATAEQSSTNPLPWIAAAGAALLAAAYGIRKIFVSKK